jgi:hypothetical protein
MNEFDTKHALLTRTELNWLLGNRSNISNSHQYKIKSEIRKKLKVFVTLELPLLEKTGILSDNLTLFGKNLTTFSKANNPTNASNNEICAENMVGRKGLILFSM